MDAHMNRERILWIDWMKVIGMYFIIAGHFFPTGYTFLYVFNVPIFFTISGFLYKYESNNALFLKKTFFNYICPVFIIRTIIYFGEKYTYNNSDSFISIFDFWFYMLKGQQNCNGAYWFIYTLILIKCFFQYIPNKKIIIVIIFFLTASAVFLNLFNIHKNNAILNVTVSIQPFAFGYYLRQYKEYLNKYQVSPVSFIILFAFSILIIIYCGETNGNVWLYQNGYGKSIILYLIGVIGGTIFLFIVSKLLGGKGYRFISILSTGNILTLGCHQIFVSVIQMNINTNNYLSYALAFLVLLLFIPLITICKSYFPFIIGIYHPLSNQNYTKT